MFDGDWQTCLESWLASRRSAATRRAYAADVQAFFAWAPAAAQPGGITPAQAAGWAEALRAEYDPATVCRRVAAVSSLYQYASLEFGLATVNPFRAPSLRPRISPYGRSQILRIEDVRLIVGRIPLTDPAGWRDLAVLVGLFITARRVSEWLALRGRDLQPDGRRVIAEITGKGDKPLRQTLPPGLWQIVRQYLRLDARFPLAADDWLFPSPVAGQALSARSVGDMLRRYGRPAGISEEKLHPHALRHGGAHERRQRGADTLDLRLLLNHSTLATTQIYVEHLLDVPDDPLGERIIRELCADAGIAWQE